MSLALLHGGVSHLYLFFKSEVKVSSETVGGTTDPLLLGNFAQWIFPASLTLSLSTRFQIQQSCSQVFLKYTYGRSVIHTHFFANTVDISHKGSMSEMGVLKEFPVSWKGVPETVLSGSIFLMLTYISDRAAPCFSSLSFLWVYRMQPVFLQMKMDRTLLEDCFYCCSGASLSSLGLVCGTSLLYVWEESADMGGRVVMNQCILTWWLLLVHLKQEFGLWAHKSLLPF